MRVHDDWLLTHYRLAIHEPTATAVAADLHLGYGQARRRRGDAVPGDELGDTLAALAVAKRDFPFRRLVVAGDLGEEKLDRSVLEEFLAGIRKHDIDLAAVVPGNHDRHIERHADLIPLYPDGFKLESWRVVHGDSMPAGRLVFGHFHPCLRCNPDCTVPCYLAGADRLVLPAFSHDAAGGNVLRLRRWAAFRCYPISEKRVFDFGVLKGMKAHKTRPERQRRALNHRR